ARVDGVGRLLAEAPTARATLRVELLGPYDRDAAARARALGLDGVVRFTGMRPHAETRAAQRAADLLLLWRPHGPGFRTMVPGKLYEYLASGRPVLALLEEGDEAADLVRRAGGQVIAPGAAEALERAAREPPPRWRAGERAADQVPDWLGGHTPGHPAGEPAPA